MRWRATQSKRFEYRSFWQKRNLEGERKEENEDNIPHWARSAEEKGEREVRGSEKEAGTAIH